MQYISLSPDADQVAHLASLDTRANSKDSRDPFMSAYMGQLNVGDVLPVRSRTFTQHGVPICVEVRDGRVSAIGVRKVARDIPLWHTPQ
jgi:hypothetical protein